MTRPRIDKSALAYGEPPRITDQAWRRSARDRACDVCRINDQTIVLAHFRRAGCGIGIKPHDAEGLFLCGRCHAEWDTSPDREGWLIDNYVVPQMHRRYRGWKAAQS